MKLARLFLVSLLSTICLALDFSGVPTCAVECIGPLLIKYNCNISSTPSIENCLCVDTKVEAPISKCVRTHCNFTEIVAAKKAQDVLCEGFKTPTRQPQLIASNIILTLGVIIFVALRYWSRFATSQNCWWDDYILLAAAGCLIALQGVSIWGALIGFGLHIWNVEPRNEISLYKFLYVYEILYTVLQCLSKSSILLLYWRIFPQRWLRNAIIILMILAIIQMLIFLFTLMFLCRPFALNFDKSLNGKCLNLYDVVLVGGVSCFLQDIVIWLLPIPSILMMRLRTSRKLAVVGIMGVGIIAVIASMIRLKYLVNYPLSMDQNWDDFGIAVMSSIELSLSLMCICFPPIKPLLNLWFPKLFNSSDNNPNRTFSLQVPDLPPISEVASAGRNINVNRNGRKFLEGILTKLSLAETGWGLGRWSVSGSKGSEVDSGVDTDTKKGRGSIWLDSKVTGTGSEGTRGEDIELSPARSREVEGNGEVELKGGGR